ncbi:hypothetical protein [Sphingomonas sp. SUN039]|uniref:hypothetical protein n=1 Tax=Sphingomonas sp. SUN039 TaxID=2937787 RepID=UPI0021648555|nr:hypothetical protein [Sphingomonas sp. SUN039]UVO53966.1 hypothetical protein M0209_07460 [Sphingomonas sp. SUN039]
MARINRHDLYYRLIDISFVVQLFCLAQFFVRIVSGRVFLSGAAKSVAVTAFVLSILIPAILIFCRFMRDDFSEQLWQKTAGSVLKCLVILPVPIAFFVSLALATGTIHIPPGSLLTDSERTTGAINGIIRSMVVLWLLTPALFTFTFQWHRWRASR